MSSFHLPDALPHLALPCWALLWGSEGLERKEWIGRTVSLPEESLFTMEKNRYSAVHHLEATSLLLLIFPYDYIFLSPSTAKDIIIFFDCKFCPLSTHFIVTYSNHHHPSSFFFLTFCSPGGAEFICKVQNNICIRNTSISWVKL